MTWAGVPGRLAPLVFLITMVAPALAALQAADVERP